MTLPARMRRRIVEEPNSGCWLWSGALSDTGYGSTFFNGKTVGAHRASWIAHHGPIVDDACVLHRCDVRACINPAHLYLGSKADNSQDMARKGRAGPGPMRQARGARCGAAKLTDDSVRDLRRLWCAGNRNKAALARAFGVSRKAIALALVGETWAHVPFVAGGDRG